MSLEIHQRYEIVFLSRHELGPKLGLKAVAKVVKCDKKTVKYWLERWDVSKDLSDLERSGRPRVTSADDDQQIIQLANKETFTTSHDIKKNLEAKGIEVSESTIIRRLHEASAKFNLPISKPLLTEQHRLNRLKWAHDHQETNWNQVIFSDETTVFLNRVKGRVWNVRGKKKVVRVVQHPIKVNVWACFSSKGFGNIVCFKNNLNAKLLCKIYQHALLPTVATQFGLEDECWQLQEDNDPKHRSKMATSWKTEKNINNIDWPSRSPELAPMENVWHILKMNLRKKNLKTYRSLVLAIKREWNKLPTELALKLSQSMKTRISELVANQGDFIMY